MLAEASRQIASCHELKRPTAATTRQHAADEPAALADFKTPEQWVFQVHPHCNHALWFAGHMATSDNFFLSLVAPEKARATARVSEPVWHGLAADRATRRLIRRRRAVLETCASGGQRCWRCWIEMTDDDLAKKDASRRARVSARRGIGLRAGDLARGPAQRPAHRRPPGAGPQAAVLAADCQVTSSRSATSWASVVCCPATSTVMVPDSARLAMTVPSASSLRPVSVR